MCIALIEVLKICDEEGLELLPSEAKDWQQQLNLMPQLTDQQRLMNIRASAQYWAMTSDPTGGRYSNTALRNTV